MLRFEVKQRHSVATSRRTGSATSANRQRFVMTSGAEATKRLKRHVSFCASMGKQVVRFRGQKADECKNWMRLYSKGKKLPVLEETYTVVSCATLQRQCLFLARLDSGRALKFAVPRVPFTVLKVHHTAAICFPRSPSQLSSESTTRPSLPSANQEVVFSPESMVLKK